MNRVAAIVLAGGVGRRMKSSLPKVLHQVAGRPILFYPFEVVKGLGVEMVIVVVGHKRDKVMEVIQRASISGMAFVEQEPQLGTGHAVMCAEEALKGWDGDILILSGDVPFIKGETLSRLVDAHRIGDATISFLTTILDNPSGYGRVVRGPDGAVARVVEERDATSAELAIKEINAGIYCVKAPFLFSTLKGIRADNVQGEYYLPDLIEMAMGQGLRVSAIMHPHPQEVMGINNRVELAEANRVMRERINQGLMLSGVTLLNPDAVYIHYGIQVGRDTTVYPNVFLEGKTSIGEGCTIEEGCKIVDSTVGDGSAIKAYTVIEGSVIGKGASIGPFARIRPETVIEDAVRIGNFVEVKRSRIGKGTKANHLSYLGDAIIGEDVNIGAGTITCNYDGIKKHQTIIEDGAFIGSDTQLVAPVRIGKDAYIGSGSTITKDVPPGALALTRVEQRNTNGWVLKRQLKVQGSKLKDKDKKAR